MKRNALMNLMGSMLLLESALIMRLAVRLHDKSEAARNLQELSNYYAHLLDKNDVVLSKFDLLALYTILTNSDTLESG